MDDAYKIRMFVACYSIIQSPLLPYLHPCFHKLKESLNKTNSREKVGALSFSPHPILHHHHHRSTSTKTSTPTIARYYHYHELCHVYPSARSLSNSTLSKTARPYQGNKRVVSRGTQTHPTNGQPARRAFHSIIHG